MSFEFPRRGEVWMVNLDPMIGVEIRKTRPAVVLSSDAIGILPLKLVAPITEWKEAFSRMTWMVRLDSDDQNGLRKRSSVDVLQTRSVDVQRLVKKIGTCSKKVMKDIDYAIADIIEIED